MCRKGQFKQEDTCPLQSLLQTAPLCPILEKTQSSCLLGCTSFSPAFLPRFPPAQGHFWSSKAQSRACGHRAWCLPFSGELGNLAEKSPSVSLYGFSPGLVLNHQQQKLSHARQSLLPAIFSNTPKIKVVHSVSHLSGQSSHRFSPTVPVFWNANSITTYAKAAHEYI